MTASARPSPAPSHHHRLFAGFGGRARDAHAGMFGLARHADWYESVPGRLARPLYRQIAKDVAAAGLPDDGLVLDVGTGPGRLPRLIAERCPTLRIQGIDLSEQMIRRAQSSLAGADVAPGRITYQVADVAALPHADDSVDLVVSSLSLHHWADVPAGLTEIARVLRPNGSAWIYDVRPVLARIVPEARRDGINVTLQPLASGEPRRRGLARLFSRAGRGLIGRLTVPPR
jgi:ubiquinone/menaquinone biosynthesis C-methylase UbiE